MDDEWDWRKLIDELTPEQISEIEQREESETGWYDDLNVKLYATANSFASDNAKARLVNRYADYPEAARYAAYCWDRGMSLRGYDGAAQLGKAQALVIQLIDQRFIEVADEHVTEILENIYGKSLGVDIPACWELYRQQQRAAYRQEIQQRYARPLAVNSGAAQAISRHTGPPPALWGANFNVLWSSGEPLLIEAGYGAGKTTLAGLLVRAQLFGGDVLGYPVQRLPDGQKILYLAIDRPDQIMRSMSRQFSPQQLAEMEITGRLIIWRGPLPADAAENNDLYVDLCDYHQAHYVYVDSLKDAARGLTEDRAAAAYQATRTRMLARGRQLVELHHLAKSGADYGSVWLRAGAGSVLRMSGKAGGTTGVLTHEKQPAHRVDPIKIAHDRDRGELDVAQAEAPVELVGWIADQEDGVTAADAAQLLYGEVGRAELRRTKRKLTDLVDSGELRAVVGQGPSNPTRWYSES
jgi:hypothetical protein